MAPEVASLPCPGFEGFEKRLEVHFSLPATVPSGKLAEVALGLRAISHEELDAMLAAAQCTVVDSLRNEHFDSYVLSESSLFVYPTKVVIKTCGTTRLLDAVPLLLDSAARVDMQPKRCKYTRGTFMFPQVQPAPYQDFMEEVKVLERHFGHLAAGGGKSFVLGDVAKFPNWHVYVSDAEGLEPLQKPTYTLEMCMTQLDQRVAGQFYQGAAGRVAADVTVASGIGALLPGSSINDFMFEPCGYSMNGIEMGAHSTMHITPEDGFSYASFETQGYGDAEVDLNDLVRRVCQVFRPGSFSVAVHADGRPGGKGPGSWGATLSSPAGYFCQGAERQDLPFGSCTSFHTFSAHEIPLTAVPTVPLYKVNEPMPPLFTSKQAGGAYVVTTKEGAGETKLAVFPEEIFAEDHRAAAARALGLFCPRSSIAGSAARKDAFMRGIENGELMQLVC